MGSHRVHDQRLQAAVDRRVSFQRGLTKYTPPCPNGFQHVPHVESGNECNDDFGLAFVICKGPLTRRCGSTPLSRQMPPIVRLELLKEVHRMSPPPGGAKKNSVCWTLAIEDLAEEIRGDRDVAYMEYGNLEAALTSIPRPPFTTHVLDRASIEQGKSIIEVLVLVYAKNARGPIEFTANGVLEEGRVAFALSRTGVLGQLEQLMNDTVVIEAWKPDDDSWHICAEEDSTQWLSLHQAMLYRVLGVTNLAELANAKADARPCLRGQSARPPGRLYRYLKTLEGPPQLFPMAPPAKTPTESIKRARSTSPTKVDAALSTVETTKRRRTQSLPHSGDGEVIDLTGLE